MVDSIIEPKLSSPQLMGLLRAKYSMPDWALIEEVRDGTGFATAGKRIDAMALSLWPSRGLELLGFELKVSRSDLARELLNPAKADDFYSYVDRWYLVVNDKNMLKPGELPATWGLIAPRGDNLAIITEAPKHSAKPLNRLFVAAIVRKLHKSYIPKEDIDQRVKDLVSEEVVSATYRLENRLEEANELREKVNKFKQASGIDLENEWRFGAAEMGRVVRAILDFHLPDYVRNIRDAAERTSEALALLQTLPIFKKEKSNGQ